MILTDLFLLLGFTGYLTVEFLLFRYMRKKKWKGLIPLLLKKKVSGE